MRGLKLFTSASFIFGVVLLVAWPWLLGPQPAATGTNRRIVAEWGVKALIYFLLCCIAFLSSATGAWLIMRRTRREFTSMSRQNVKELVEGSLRDHGQPASPKSKDHE